MESQGALQLVFEGMVDGPVVVQSSAGMMSSDAGLIPLRELDRRLKFIRRFADCLDDSRVDPDHTQGAMIRQRLFGIIAGYEDCNDHDDLRSDPVFKVVAERSPGDDDLGNHLAVFESVLI